MKGANIMTKKQMLFTLFLFGTGVSASATTRKNIEPQSSQSQAGKISLQQLKTMGIVVWNVDKQAWELDLAKLQAVVNLDNSSATPFDEHTVYSEDQAGPLAIGNW